MDEMIAEVMALWLALYSPDGDLVVPSFSLASTPAGVSASVRADRVLRGDHSVSAKPTASAAVTALRDMMRMEARTTADKYARRIAALRAALGEVEPQPIAAEPEASRPAVVNLDRDD